MTKLLKPKILPKNATIGIISPASPQRNEDFLLRGVKYLESLGYRVELGKNVWKRHNEYLAGTDEERIDDIEYMFANPKIDAIFCSRGGYGTPRILKYLNYSIIEQNPKIFVGFSDITALQSAIFRKTGIVTFSGAMPAVDMRDEFLPESEEFFWKILTTTKPIGEVHQSEPMRPMRQGIAKGRMYCGNLSLFASLIGTPFSPNFRGGILLAEDIGEEPYRIDRLLSHFENSGIFDLVRGIAFGQFTDIPKNRAATPQPDILTVLEEYSQRAKLPAISNVLFGHLQKKLTLPFGIRAEINGHLGKMSLLESALIK